MATITKNPNAPRQVAALFNHPGLEGLSVPARAYSLAKAAFEAMREKNFDEQRAALVAATADDPEPVEPELKSAGDRQRWLDYHAQHEAWHKRNEARIDAATKPVIARYPRELEKLAKLAEENLVDYAEEQITGHFGTRAAAVKPAFKAYREGDLYGDMRKRFLKICFNCPAS
jgi:hypothetical protein